MSSWAVMPAWEWNWPPSARVIRYRRALLSTNSARSPAANGRDFDISTALTRLAAGPLDQAAEGAHLTGRGRAAPRALLQLLLLGRGLRYEQCRRLVEKHEVEGVLGAGRLVLDGVQRLLVPQVPVASGHRALLDLVIDARQDAVGGRLAFAEAHEGLHLAHEAVAGGQDRQLAAEVLGGPPEDIAEQDRGLVGAV